MITSPEALRKAVERLEAWARIIERPAPDGDNSLKVAASVAEQHARDLRTLLSALQEAREALDVFSKVGRLIDGPFGPGRVPDDGVFQSGCAWREGDQKRTLTWGDFRRAAEVYRALSPGGADE